MLRKAARWFQAGDTDAAAALCRHVLAGEPDNAAALHILGLAAGQAGNHGAAIGLLERALRSNPAVGSGSLVAALRNQALTVQAEGRPAAAIALFRQAQTLAPEDPFLKLGEAMARLLTGDFAAGWAGYRWRWQLPHIHKATPVYPRPAWAGEVLRGRTLLLWPEQGLGDTLQFIRYAGLVRERGATVLFRCPPELFRLLEGHPHIDRLCRPEEALPPFDCHAPLLDLPHLCGTILATIPAGVPYLAADPGRAAAWAQRIAGYPGLKVGLVWAGNPRRHDPDVNADHRRRSIPLSRFTALAGLGNVTFFSLQKGDGAEQARHPPPELGLIDFTADLHDFADTAALVASLDLVITIDTSVVHLAGALARPVWLLSRYGGCWRWMLGRDDSPWYPTLRLFRQAAPDDWAAVMQQVKAALRDRLTQHPHTRVPHTC